MQLTTQQTHWAASLSAAATEEGGELANAHCQIRQQRQTLEVASSVYIKKSWYLRVHSNFSTDQDVENWEENLPYKMCKPLYVVFIREAIKAKKSQNCGLFPYGGGAAQPHSIAFGGVFPNIIEAILVDEISTK